jgi:site-specific DNA-methyltransferase (adenine-specific)
LGIEKDYNDYIKNLNEVFNQIQRVLRKDGSLWVVINDTYLRKNKSLALIPQRLMIELFNSGWIIRNNIIWQKTCPLPQSAKDRFTINYEYVIFCVKNKKYYFKTQY